jgi:hypothetical protein
LATSLAIRGKGRGKNSSAPKRAQSQQRQDPGTYTSTESDRRELSADFDAGAPGPSSTYFRPPSNMSNFTEDRSQRSINSVPSVKQNVAATTTNIFIKRVDCFLNSIGIDQIEDKQNEDECIQAYWRLFQANGQINSMVTNGISYDDFRNGYFFAAFDLSTSGKSGTGFVVPSIR